MFRSIKNWLDSPQLLENEEKIDRARVTNRVELYFISGWIVCVGLAFLSGGINSPMIFILGAITIAVGLLFSPRYGKIFLLLSILFGLGFALLQEFGVELPQIFYESPVRMWLFFSASLVFTYWIGKLTVRRLEDALALVRKNETSRQQVEEALRQSDERFQKFMLHFPGLVYMKDADGRTLFASQGFQTYLGLDPEKMLGRTSLDIFGVEFGGKIYLDDLAVLESRKNQVFEEVFAGRTWNTYKFAIDLPGARTLLGGITMDITDRKRAEVALHESQERFQKAFRTNPTAIAITRIKDGLIIDVNDGWCELFGYSRKEALGRTVTELGITSVDMRRKTQLHLMSGGLIRNEENIFHTRAGGARNILFSMEDIELGGEPCLIATMIDITERKQAENIMQVRLRISEYATEHSLEELLQNELDELCALTDSPIGFFHFVDPDRHALTLQAWSTKTLKEMCTAQGRGRHYDIDQAGVWADCARQGAPVIHNDYASLPQRKGLPEGHAQVVREMVLPVFDDQKMVAIIGIGNKAQDYNLSDLAYASQLANMLWDITKRKQAEEAEREQRALAEALSNSAAALNSTLNFDEVLDRIIDNVEQVVPHDAVELSLLDEAHQAAQIVGYHRTSEHPVDLKGFPFPMAQTRNLREMLTSGEPVIIAEVSAYEGWFGVPLNEWVHAHLGVPIQVKGEIIGFLCVASSRPDAFTQRDARRLKAFVDHAAIAIENARLYEQVQKLALTDVLTGVYNRTFFETELARMELCRDFPVSIIIADLDNMKITNDSLGHLAGDELLRRTVRVLESIFRAADIIARIGGDEFAVLLPNTDSPTVEMILSRIRGKLDEHNAEQPELPIQLSLGAYTANQGKLMEAFTLADQRMYADKAARKAKA